MHKPIPLPLFMHFEGDTLTQRKRSGNVAWYDRSGNVIEVIKIRVRNAWVWHGKLKPTQEVYPGTSDFGSYGKCISGPNREERAEVVFQMLVREEQDKAIRPGHSESKAVSTTAGIKTPDKKRRALF